MGPHGGGMRRWGAGNPAIPKLPQPTSDPDVSFKNDVLPIFETRCTSCHGDQAGLSLETYEAIGHNAARYAKGLPVKPVAVEIDNTARLRLIVKTALLHRHETEAVRDQKVVELLFNWEPDL